MPSLEIEVRGIPQCLVACSPRFHIATMLRVARRSRLGSLSTSTSSGVHIEKATLGYTGQCLPPRARVGRRL
jgi:hypothetical protein